MEEEGERVVRAKAEVDRAGLEDGDLDVVVEVEVVFVDEKGL